MNRIYYILLAILSYTAFTSCSNDEVVSSEDTDTGIKAVVPTKYLDGINDPTTRSSLSLVGNSMVYSWMAGDRIGVFNVTYDETTSDNAPFIYKTGTERREGSITYAKFRNDNFSFNQENYWVAYAPYNCVSTGSSRVKVQKYNEIVLSYEGQQGMYNATPSGKAPKSASSSEYNSETEAKASSTLSDYDYLISAPAQPDDQSQTTFNFSHVGSTVRFWVHFPDGAFGGRGKSGYIKSMDLLCKSSKIVKGVTLAIKQNPSGNITPSYDLVEGTKLTTQKLTLNLPGPNNNGIELPDIEGGCNFINYMEFYPTTFSDNECYLYMTVVVDGVERYFRSKELPARTIVAGKLYQWHPETDEPIELTATLQSWQDIVTGLSTDLEK